MATSSVDICNQALVAIGVETITSLTSTNPQPRERACRTIYDHVRDLLLAEHDWSFQTKRVELTANATAPDFEFDYYYNLPVDFVMPIELYGLTGEWVIEFGPSNRPALLTNADDDVFLVYLASNDDVSDWIVHFHDALAMKLASRLAISLRDSQPLADRMELRAREAIGKAALIDSRNKRPSVNEDAVYANDSTWQSEGR